MKIKMADVARYLGLSKATVSLAVNGKPGVNPQTKERIFRCIEEMERNGGVIPENSPLCREQSPQLIKVVIFNRRKSVVCDPEMDLWSGILRTFDKEVRKRGYLYGLTYFNENAEDIQRIVEECNLDIVAGVVLFGTELDAEDYEFLKYIQKPMVIYDYEMPDGSCSSVCIDNGRAAEMAVEQLLKAGVLEIRYLGTEKNIYNFQKRREGFLNALLKAGKPPKKDEIILLGSSIGEITERVTEYLADTALPDAFVMENYQVSIAVLTAVRKLRIAVPKKLKLIGIDEIPEYILSDFQLTQIRIPHEERAAMTIDLLDREISQSWKAKMKAFVLPELLKGESI